MPALSHPELEAAILRAPDDSDAYLVYGDWLQGQGDPRGELIMLMHQLERAGETQDALQERILELFQHAPKGLLGEALARRLAKQVNVAGARHGLRVCWEKAPTGPPQLLVDGWWQGPRFVTKCLLDWRLGFINRALLESEKHPPGLPNLEPGLTSLIRQLLPHVSARFLRTLGIHLSLVDEPEYVSVLQALVETGCPRTLETLILSASRTTWDRQVLDTAVSLEPLYPRLSRLRKLVLPGHRLELGVLRLPELRELSILSERQGGALRRPALRSIANAELPRLKSLSFWVGRPQEAKEAPEARLDDLQPLLDRRGMPSLRRLALFGVEFADALCQRLPHSTLLPQLRELELVYGTMSAAGAEALLSEAPAFRHLRRLRLHGRLLDRGLQQRLMALCKNVDIQ